MAHLHHDKNRAKLVHFKEKKKYIAFLKHANLAQFSPKCKGTLRDYL